MTKIFLIMIGCLALLSCKANGPNFSRMSPNEIAAYNKTVPLMDNIICEESAHLMSRIPKRRCETVAERQGSLDDSFSTLSNVHNGDRLFD